MVTLERSKFFGELCETEMTSVLQHTQQKTFKRGQEIFREGESGDGLYVVKEGEVDITALAGPDVRRVISKISEGEMFGEMAVVEDKPRSASAVASKVTTVYFISRDEMLRLIEKSPVLALTLLREISNRLREFNRQYLSEVLQTERLAVIGRFARSIVHDLKNPLNIIGITAELAGMPQASPEVRKDAQGRIRKQVDRISDMIGEILEFTQVSQSAVILAPTDYATFVKFVFDELRAETALKSAQLEIQGEIPALRLPLDPKRLRRVFYNLVHNATDAMPEGGRIVIRARQENDEIVTEIEDSGKGIAPEIADKMFEAFATFGKTHGTGLGLSISKRIIEDHHGWIKARNQPGSGAVFCFGLPLTAPKP